MQHLRAMSTAVSTVQLGRGGLGPNADLRISARLGHGKGAQVQEAVVWDTAQHPHKSERRSVLTHYYGRTDNKKLIRYGGLLVVNTGRLLQAFSSRNFSGALQQAIHSNIPSLSRAAIKQVRFQSTESFSLRGETKIPKPSEGDRATEAAIVPNFRVTFDDCQLAFSGKSIGEIVRALVVLRMCSLQVVTDNSAALMSACRRILGGRVTDWVLKRTVYGQFVGGETRDEIVRAVDKLRAVGVGPLLAVPMEDDIHSHHSDADRHFDANLATVLDSMSLACDLDPVYPMIQLKITALMPGDLCALISKRYPKPSSCPDVVDDVWRSLEGHHLNVTKLFGEDFPETMAVQLLKGLQRVARVCEAARARRVIVMVDAEYTYLNPALNLLALAMMLRCNATPSSPIVFYTYQNYLKSCRETLERDMTFLSSRGVGFGAKMVRGAYMYSERKTAAREGTEDPVHDALETTSAAYNANVARIMEKMAASPDMYRLMVATHNEESALLAVKRMEDLGIRPDAGVVFFGQLFGMADHISCSLGVSGFQARKSLPYGSVEETVPYLSRRAQENHAVLAGVRKENGLLSAELWRRLKIRRAVK